MLDLGNDAEAWHGILGKFGHAEKNENGVRMLDFYALNDLVVTNTVFLIHYFILYFMYLIQAICWIMFSSVVGLDAVLRIPGSS